MSTETKAIATRDQNALAKPVNSFGSLKELITSRQSEILTVCDKLLDAERLTRLFLSIAGRDEKLLQCTGLSLMRALMDCATLGLEPTGRVGGAYLVAYRNGKLSEKAGHDVYEAQIVTDYRGEMILCLRSGHVVDVKAVVVRAGEKFREIGGSEPRLIHEVNRDPKVSTGDITHAYALGLLRSNGKYTYEVLSRAQIEERRSRSQNPGQTWAQHFEAMAKKSAIRALTNRLPKMSAVAAFVEREDYVDTHAETYELDAESEVVRDDDAPPPPPKLTGGR